MNQIFVTFENVQRTENTEENAKVRAVSYSDQCLEKKNCKSQTRILCNTSRLAYFDNHCRLYVKSSGQVLMDKRF